MTTTLSASIRDDAGHGLLHRSSASPARRRLRRVQAIWALLILNVLTFFAGAPHILPIPGAAGKMITQFALVAALMLALSVNRPAAVRPSVFILLLSLLAAEAMITSLWAEFLGRRDVPDRPAAGFRVRALAAHAVVGPARPAAGARHT